MTAGHHVFCCYMYCILECGRTVMEQEYFDEILCPSVANTGQTCGSLLRRHQRFCHQCGTEAITSWFVKQIATPRVCTGVDEDGNVCGWQLDFGAKFCSNCGARSKLSILIV